jgi:hypothetical protein
MKLLTCVAVIFSNGVTRVEKAVALLVNRPPRLLMMMMMMIEVALRASNFLPPGEMNSVRRASSTAV